MFHGLADREGALMSRVSGTPDRRTLEVAVCAKCGGAFPRDRRANREFCSDRCRFWAQVDVRRPDECWPWKGRFNALGYGVQDRVGGSRIAHRQAWEWGHGAEVPAGLFVGHSCGSRGCCNPRHLFLGSKARINAQMRAAGRDCHSRGTASHHFKKRAATPREAGFARLGRLIASTVSRFLPLHRKEPR